MFQIAVVIAVVFSGCATGPQVGPNSIRAYTPPRYLENRLMFLRPDTTNTDRWKLVWAYKSYASADEKALAVKPGDPLSVVVGDVYMPRDFKGRKDVVVMLDIVASSSRGLESYAIWYQRGVGPGQRLGFDSILVYSDRAWSPLNPPRFTVRVMDVSTEKNAETRAAFDGLNKAVGSVAAFIPHPAVPAAAAALRVAGLVASNRQNVPIIDFTPQFYGADFVASAGPSDIPLFMRGTWLVIGRQEGATEDFWRQELFMDRQTGQVFAGTDPAPLPVPYMRVTIATAEAVVPSMVLEHSEALFKLLSQGRTGDDVVTAVSKELTSSMKTFNLHKELVGTRSKSALKDITAMLDNTVLTGEDKQFLLTIFNRTTGQNFSDANEAKSWWSSNESRGDIDKETGRWKESP